MRSIAATHATAESARPLPPASSKCRSRPITQWPRTRPRSLGLRRRRDPAASLDSISEPRRPTGRTASCPAWVTLTADRGDGFASTKNLTGDDATAAPAPGPRPRAYRRACATSSASNFGRPARISDVVIPFGHQRHHRGHRDPQPADTRLAGHLVRLDGDAIENHTSSVEPDQFTGPLRSPQHIPRARTGKRAKRVLSGAVRAVIGTTTDDSGQDQNGYAQVNGHFHAQTRTCPASLPS